VASRRRDRRPVRGRMGSDCPWDNWKLGTSEPHDLISGMMSFDGVAYGIGKHQLRFLTVRSEIRLLNSELTPMFRPETTCSNAHTAGSTVR
jgi:hypothetical protein